MMLVHRGEEMSGVKTVLLLTVAILATPSSSYYLEELVSLKPKVPDSIQEDTVRGLISRIVPQHSHLFEIVVDRNFSSENLDLFKIEKLEQSKKLLITGTTGVAAANGFNYYLKRFANCSVSWSGDQLNLPPDLPVPDSPIEVKIRDKFRYYQNVCTVSYSMAWWNWSRWQREIDWMALRAINLPLAFNGQEVIFQRTFLRFNLTKEEIEDFFTGPAFLAWNRMGNIQTWSGPLSPHWHQQQVLLQKQILQRMNNFGMYPVVPGFAGHVPRNLSRILPEAKIDRLTDWNQFGQTYSHTYFLEPEDPNFIQIGKVFIEEYRKEFGVNHFYNIDLFNEETPTSSDREYLRKCGQGVYESIRAADPKGVWVMQGWLFENQAQFWGQEEIKSLVTSVPIGKMLILDLFSEIWPVYSKGGYFGQPFIWCMLHNFGGTLGMYGAFNRINEKVYGARRDYANMLGIGLTPEGIEQNDVVYDYMTEVTWYEREPDMAQWISEYSIRRYGLYSESVDRGWQLLRASVFTDPIGVQNHGRYALNNLPQLEYHSTMWYDRKNVTEALKLFAQTLNTHPELLNSETFVYDIVDVTRQSLQLIFDFFNQKMNVEFYAKNRDQLVLITKSMDRVLELTEEILQCSKHFLLFNWIQSARSLANDTREKDYNEWQARNQITTWGPKANIRDYAAKQWSGMVRYFYQPRWQLFFERLLESLKSEQPFNQGKYRSECFERVEEPFTKATNQTLVQEANTANLHSIVTEVINLIGKTIDQESISIEKQFYLHFEDD